MLQSPTFGNEYIFVGNHGSIHRMEQGEECQNVIPPVFKGVGPIRESMYSLEEGELSVYVLASSRRIYRYSEQSKTTGKYESLTKRKEMRTGLFYDYKEESIATASMIPKIIKGREVPVKGGFYLLNDIEKKDKTKLETCLFIYSNSILRFFPNREYKKEEFASKYPKSSTKILKGGNKWFLSGQSKQWEAYSYMAVGNAAGYSENATWLKNKFTEYEEVWNIKDCIQKASVYPDVVLIYTKKRMSKTYLTLPLTTRDYFIQLPDEEELRKIHMDPKAKHLWANAESVFFQLGKDILRVDYAEGQKDPVKICEIEEPLFCMFEKDNILAALADDDKKDKKEDGDKDKKDNDKK